MAYHPASVLAERLIQPLCLQGVSSSFCACRAFHAASVFARRLIQPLCLQGVSSSLWFGAYWGYSYKVLDGVNSKETNYKVKVRTRALLCRYDPDMCALMKEVFPCGNTLLPRCYGDHARARCKSKSLHRCEGTRGKLKDCQILSLSSKLQ